jgi:hypothetical protein
MQVTGARRLGRLIGLILVCLMAGCATSYEQQINARLSSFTGMHIDDVLSQMNRPDRVTDDGMGGKIYFWRVASSEGVAWVRLNVNESGIVWKWEWRAQPYR